MLRLGFCDEIAMKNYTKDGEWTKGTKMIFNISSQCVEFYKGKELISSKKRKEPFKIEKGYSVVIYMDWKEEKIMWWGFHTDGFAVTMPVEWINNRHTLKLHQTAELKHKGNIIQLY